MILRCGKHALDFALQRSIGMIGAMLMMNLPNVVVHCMDAWSPMDADTPRGRSRGEDELTSCRIVCLAYLVAEARGQRTCKIATSGVF